MTEKRATFRGRIRSIIALWRHLRREGWHDTARLVARRLLFTPYEFEPLWRTRALPMFASDVAQVRAEEKELRRSTALMLDAGQVEMTYPLIFESEGRILRYALLPARHRSRGLVVAFHSWDAWLKLGPLKPWDEFDLLAPWDTFGWRRQGSWFWGEKGDNFVERMVQALIVQHRSANQPLFYMGGSMGGFAALYHGIKHGAKGIYAICPQIDLKAKIEEKARSGPEDPFAYLGRNGSDGAPDLLSIAESASQLPPFYLVQSLKDPINPFAGHGFRLLDVYNRKDAWYGVRVHPATGHGADGTQEEAAYFFSVILEKLPAASEISLG